MSESANGCRISGADFSLLFNEDGSIAEWIDKKDNNILSGSIEPYFWKPANDNQMRNGYRQRLGVWIGASAQRKVKNLSKSCDGKSAVLNYDMEFPGIDAQYSIRYEIRADGTVNVEGNYNPVAEDIPLMPKFGFRMKTIPSLDSINWYGLGPHENYPDRKTSAFLGKYSMPLTDFITDYVVPQDNANRCEVRWFTLTDACGHGIKISSHEPFSFRAWPYDEEDLEKARHPYELPSRDFINVNIDLKIHGVGGNDSWGAKTLDKYTVDSNMPYKFRITLSNI